MEENRVESQNFDMEKVGKEKISTGGASHQIDGVGKLVGAGSPMSARRNNFQKSVVVYNPVVGCVCSPNERQKAVPYIGPALARGEHGLPVLV